jgi:hypothetical protein
MALWGLGNSLPIYTTRPEAGEGKKTCTYSQSAWITLLAKWVVFFNILLWGGIGIYEAVRFIV